MNRSATDRFSSREEIRFNDSDFRAGVLARRNGWKLEDCPFKDFNHKTKSWRAGWCDEDQSIAAMINS